jgi:hypothetical protein
VPLAATTNVAELRAGAAADPDMAAAICRSARDLTSPSAASFRWATLAWPLLCRPSAMRARAALLVLLVLLAAPAAAAADPPAAPPGPDWSLHLEVGLTTGGLGGALGEAWSIDRGGFTIGAGIRRHQLAAAVRCGMFAVDSSRPERDNADLLAMDLGGDVTVYLREGQAEPFLRVGYRKTWFHGSTAVIRTCEESGGCLGGFWTVVPSYSAHGPVIAIGEQLTLRSRSDHQRQSMLFLASVQLEAAPLEVELPGGAVTGRYVGLRLSIGFGGGPDRSAGRRY